MAGIFEEHCSPTAEENSFCSSSSDQGALLSLSTSTLSGKMPKNCTGSQSGQDHCLHKGTTCMSSNPMPLTMKHCTQPWGSSRPALGQAAEDDACMTCEGVCRRGDHRGAT